MEGLDRLRALARERFGIGRLRPAQERALTGLLSGRDTVAVLPTGYGKSLVYQLLAWVVPGPIVVVSPLIALMRDQERSMGRLGLPVTRLDSTLRKRERATALAEIARGGPRVILTTPETLQARDARPSFEQSRPSLLCVDEAHCISEWGHDFRPAYLRLGLERRALAIPMVLALTATATPRVETDIAERLGMREPLVVRASPDRPNMHFRVEHVPGNLKQDMAGRLIRRLGRPGIVYCATTKAVDEIHAALSRARIPVARYHGKLPLSVRTEAQQRFMQPDKRMVMVATSAFGMGIDKPNIRYVLHYQVPGSLEQYVQEAGRAGRDGRPCDCILLFDEDDLAVQTFLNDQGRPRADQLRRVARALSAWASQGPTVGLKELAMSAGIPQTTCRALCAHLEDLGVLRSSDAQHYEVSAPSRLRGAAADLAKRFETLRREDEHRLAAVAAYALTDACRSASIRRWFGEQTPPACGRCDQCRRTQRISRDARQMLERAERAHEPITEPRRRRRRRRR